MKKNSEIQIFQSEQFGNVRVAMSESNEPLFCLADVCQVLDLTPSKVAQRLEDDVLSKYPITDSLGREQQANFVNEDGLYDAILDSRKPEAKQFRKWVTSEVLPSIRKHGAYMVTTEEDTPETIMAKAVIYAEKKIKEQAQQLKEEKSARYELEQEAVANKPKIDWAVRNQQSKGLHTVSSCVQEQRICAEFMNKVLEHYKIQRKLSGEWSLTAAWQNKGFAEAVPTIIEREGKDDKTTLQLKWFEKGRRLMLNLIKHAEADGFIYINKKTGRYSISKAGFGFTPFKFID